MFRYPTPRFPLRWGKRKNGNSKAVFHLCRDCHQEIEGILTVEVLYASLPISTFHISCSLPKTNQAKEAKMKLMNTDMVIAGLGPAGFEAAIYGAEALLPKKLTIVSPKIGSQADTTPEITNWPGIPRISGQAFQTMIKDHFEELVRKYKDYLNIFIPAKVVGVERAAENRYMVNISYGGKNPQKNRRIKTACFANRR